MTQTYRTEIPAISESQLKLMVEVCRNPDMSVFSQTAPIEGDDKVIAGLMEEGRKDANYLVSLGFLKNITADHQEQINKVSAETKRDWQVFEVTALGRALFQAYTSPTIH